MKKNLLSNLIVLKLFQGIYKVFLENLLEF